MSWVWENYVGIRLRNTTRSFIYCNVPYSFTALWSHNKTDPSICSYSKTNTSLSTLVLLDTLFVVILRVTLFHSIPCLLYDNFSSLLFTLFTLLFITSHTITNHTVHTIPSRFCSLAQHWIYGSLSQGYFNLLHYLGCNC